MQWDGSPNAGFSTATPWLPVSEDFHRRNVKSLAEDPASILTLYKRLLDLRRTRRALSVGDYVSVLCERNLMVYERRKGAERLLVALNFGHEPENVALTGGASVVLSTHLDRAGETLSGRCTVRPDEGVILALT
jgi:alpha-glucosidase